MDHLDLSFDIGKEASHFLNLNASGAVLNTSIKPGQEEGRHCWMRRAGSEPGWAVEMKVATEDLEPAFQIKTSGFDGLGFPPKFVKSVPLRA